MSGDKARAERIALNESAYREMNEWVTAGQPALGLLGVLCECGREGCSEVIRLASDEYRSVRRNPLRFLVSPAHLIPDAEFQVEARSDYWVVEKFEDVSDLAEATKE